MLSVEHIIRALKGTDPYIETIFMRGGCYQFHLFLKEIYPGAVPMINSFKDHVISLIDGCGYDITGAVETNGYQALTDSDVAIVREWSFSKEQALSLGECKFCEEPILV